MSETGDPRVSAVMITYNRRDEVLRTLGRMTTLPERPRVIVVDNGSTDGTADAVRARFGADRVRVVEAGANLGARGRNLGVELTDTPYVAFCDDDTWWDPGDLARAADLLDASPKLAIVTGRCLVGPEEVEDPICRELAASPLPREAGMPGPPLLGFMAGVSVVRRSSFREARGFHAHIHVGGEEEWLAVELAARGYWICYVPQITVHHHPSAFRDPEARRWQVVRNTLWFVWLRRPVRSALRRTWWMLLNGPFDGRHKLKGFAAALVGMPRLLPQRRVVPPWVEQGLQLLDPGRGGPEPSNAAS